MSGGISSPGGRTAPLRFSPCLWGSWPFLLWSRQVSKLQLAAHWGTGRKQQWKIHTCWLLRWAWTRKSRTREWTACAVSCGPCLSFGLTCLLGCWGAFKQMQIHCRHERCKCQGTHHNVAARTVSAPRFAVGANRDKKRWNPRLWICLD